MSRLKFLGWLEKRVCLLRNRHTLFVCLKLTFQTTLLVSLNDIALQDKEDDHQRQDSDSGTHKEFVQVKYLCVQEIGKYDLNSVGRRILTND